MARWLTYSLLLSCCTAAAWSFQAAGPFKPGKLSPAEVSTLQQGLTLRFDGKAEKDARRIRLAALHVPAGTAPSPFIPPGPFQAKISGYIKNPLKGPYSFRVTGTGAIVLKINEKVIPNQAEVVLAKNYNRLEIDYTSPAQGDATMRLYWSAEKFGFEPVPPEVLYTRGDEADLVAQTALREGRFLYANRHCADCHGLPGNATNASAQMPELQNTPPSLDDAGSRFQAGWLTAWLLDPRKLRPEATMPSVLSGADAGKQAADIAAYVAMLKQAAPLAPLGKGANAGAGEALFKKLGCNSCHRLSAPEEKDELDRLSLYFVNAKYAPQALAHFLKYPHQRYAWTRMPDFRLSDDEAGHLETYLRAEAKGEFPVLAPGDPKRGAKLFREAGCQQCHETQTGKPHEPALVRKIKALDAGCLAPKPSSKAPDFGLNPEQKSTLIAFLHTDGTSLTRDTPAEFSLRQVQHLQCASCHRRDGASTRWHQVLEDVGKVPEALPSLTWTGEKLKPAWSQKLLAGKSDHSARPWIKARMPAFTARAELLAVGLSHEHGFGVNEDNPPPPDAKLAMIGQKLLPQNGGFNCINCHGVGAQPPIQPFEAPGINLVDAALRLRHEYYLRWMLDPSRVDVTMRMPVFATDGKTTQIHDVLGGDARKQFEAIWQYIQTLPTTAK